MSDTEEMELGLYRTSREAHIASLQRCDTAGHYFMSRDSISSSLVISGLLLNKCTSVCLNYIHWV